MSQSRSKPRDGHKLIWADDGRIYVMPGEVNGSNRLREVLTINETRASHTLPGVPFYGFVGDIGLRDALIGPVEFGAFGSQAEGADVGNERIVFLEVPGFDNSYTDFRVLR